MLRKYRCTITTLDDCTKSMSESTLIVMNYLNIYIKFILKIKKLKMK